MSYKATLRAFEAARRRQEREERARLRQLERETKSQLSHMQRTIKESQRQAEKAARAQVKLNDLEQARQEVQEHEEDLALLVSVHKSQTEACDWLEIATSLPPPDPKRIPFHELCARQRATVLPSHQQTGSEGQIHQAREKDEEEFQRAAKSYADQQSHWVRTRNLALRILDKEIASYTDAIREQAPFPPSLYRPSSTRLRVAGARHSDSRRAQAG